jgi:hypothetical protein
VFGGDGERFGHNVIRSADVDATRPRACRGIVRIQGSSGLPCHDASLASRWRYRRTTVAYRLASIRPRVSLCPWTVSPGEAND